MFIEDVYLQRFDAVYNFGGYYSIPAGTGWTCATHRFEQCKFYFITEGSCHINIDGTDYTGKAGDWFFIPSGTAHSYENDSSAPFAKYWMHFDIYPDTKLVERLHLPFVVKADSDGYCLRLFKEYAALHTSVSFADRLTVKARLIELIGEYLKIAGHKEARIEAVSDNRLDALLRYINGNLHQDLSNEHLAQLYYSHPNHFVRSFKAKTGLPPAKYIRNKRMELAKRLLEGTDLSVADIAIRVGIPDPAHFSRLFRQRYNMSPSVYRKHILSGRLI